MKEQLIFTLIEALSSATELDKSQVAKLVEEPKNFAHGDLAFPCFLLAKTWSASPVECAKKLAEKINLPKGFSTAEPLGPFLNFRFDRSLFSKSVIDNAINFPAAKKKTETIIVEYSSPNIAKPFHVGHLRTTLIGNALDKTFRFLNYNTISINHLGDWGTQFGFVWAGCKLWGKPADNSVTALVDLYKKATAIKEAQEQTAISQEAAAYPNVNDMAREYFRDLEEGKPYAVEFWQWCKDITLEYLYATYKRLDAHFDHYTGESFYSDKLEAVKKELSDSGLLQESQGALGIFLDNDLGFARVFTPDGRSLYLTRDLATAEYRAKTFKFDRALYVVGAPQNLHFQQIKGVLKALGKPYADKIEHVSFGHVLGMKTRGESSVVELNDFLDEAYQRALEAYQNQVTKRPEGLDDNEVAQKVALAAIIFSNLNRSRTKDVHFSWDAALTFQGDSGPYLLYAYARINGIKQKAGLTLNPAFDSSLLSEESAAALVRCLSDFSNTLDKVIAESEPAHLANYALEVAKAFSKAYNELKVAGVEQSLADARLALFEATRLTLKQSIELLGIEPLERM